MATGEDIRKWLEKMQYPHEIPSEEALKDLCRGPLGSIFQQVIEKVKPKEEIDAVRKSIVVNKLRKTGRLKAIKDECLVMFERKLELEKQIRDVEEGVENKEENLKLLKAKIRHKDSEIEALKRKSMHNRNDETVLRAKSAQLSRDLQSATKLKDSNVFDAPSHLPTDKISEKISEITVVISNHIDSIDVKPTPHAQKVTSTPRVLYSIKKPLSIQKRNLSSNIFTSVNNLCGGTSTRKRFGSSSSDISNSSENWTETGTNWLEEFSGMVQGVKELWSGANRRELWGVIIEAKRSDTERFKAMAFAPKTSEQEDSKDNLEILYHLHIQNELSHSQSIIKTNKYQKILETEYKPTADEYTNLLAVESGLKSAISFLKSSIQKIQSSTVESTSLNETLGKIDELKKETATLRLKIENQLSLLGEFAAWTEKSYRDVQKNALRPMPVFNDEIPEAARINCEKFHTLPFDYVFKTSPSWSEALTYPEFLEIIEQPYYTPDKIISDVTAAQESFRRLTEYKKSKKPLPENSILVEKNMKHDPDLGENFSKALRTCETTSSMINRLGEVFKMQRNELPFNEYVSSKRLFEGKNLGEYVEIYNDLYSKLPDS